MKILFHTRKATRRREMHRDRLEFKNNPDPILVKLQLREVVKQVSMPARQLDDAYDAPRGQCAGSVSVMNGATHKISPPTPHPGLVKMISLPPLQQNCSDDVNVEFTQTPSL